MEILWYHFSVSGVETYLFVPPLVMAIISSMTSMAGVSGAFVLLPFQMSILGYTAPGVSATNFVYNIVAIPAGVIRHIRQKRLSWPLFTVLMLGTLPGVFIGYYIRVAYLPDPRRFKFFAGLVLAYLGIRTLQSVYKDLTSNASAARQKGNESVNITGGSFGLFKVKIVCRNHMHIFPTPPVLIVSLAVGVLGGAYGIGGGAIMAPFCISVLNLPVYVVSGAALFSTWVTSVVAVLFYAFAPMANSTLNSSPDWALGSLFGLGGMAHLSGNDITETVSCCLDQNYPDSRYPRDLDPIPGVRLWLLIR